jgi:transposase-like protein
MWLQYKQMMRDTMKLDKDTGIVEIASMTEDEARSLLEDIRWPDGVTCPHCGTVNESTLLQGEAHRPGLFQCNACRGQFTVTTGTIMHRSRISLVKWVLAFHLMCSSKKGVSALQIKRQLRLGSYQTAWHLCHRIRYAMTQGPLAGKLGAMGGIIEADETYVGGKPRTGHTDERKRGRGTSKTPVVALVERGGRVRFATVDRINAESLGGFVREHADKSATLMTDEACEYETVGKEFAGGHYATKHSADEFAKTEVTKDGRTLRVHSNTAECVFSLLKRGYVGTFHQWSPQHTDRYTTEFEFRWDRREDTDFERTQDAIRMSEGKRLTYDALPSGSPWQ